ncbi:ribosomal protein S21/MRP21 [Candidatus Dojkabacteria bacterium]|uniref:Ribosomal protein S21/MRP21 n=1 Tax=Candidatus Dojkabacteria bacterium TaxID=2099670 RepID=A0A955HZT2_9BACT|nr:ribosomal protein S21/MRP21 [Candidatus Dojkabacteria bacterium]
MSVIVHPNENIDVALGKLQREMVRENILGAFRDKVYRIKKSVLKVQQRREWGKMKRRRRKAARRAR